MQWHTFWHNQVQHYEAKNTALSNFPPISNILYHFLSVHKKETAFASFILWMQPTVQHRNTLTRAAFNGKTPHDTLPRTRSSDFKLILTLSPPYWRHGFFHFCVPMLRNSVIPAVFIKHITIISFKLITVCFCGQFFKYRNYFTPNLIVFKGEPRRLLKLLLAGCFILDDLLLQVFLVRLNVPWPLGHCSILTYPYLFSNLQNIWTAYCWHTIYTWTWFTFIQNLQFSVKHLHGICLALCVSIRQLPIFQTMMYKKLLTFYSGKHRIPKTRKWVDNFYEHTHFMYVKQAGYATIQELTFSFTKWFKWHIPDW